MGRLAQQSLDRGRYEVLVGLDGPDAGSESGAKRAWREAGGGPGLTVIACEKRGQASVRNRLLPLAQGRFLLFLNDDVLPEPDLAAAHLRHQEARSERGHPAMIVGAAPWRRHDPDRLFDRLLRETSMVFFYDVMERESDPDRDWGFRHAWMLNLSAPAEAVRAVGGLSVFPATYGYEDDELAFRLVRRLGLPVLYRPDAVAVHDHRMEPREYLEREERLGFAAWGFAGAAPQCAAAMFRRDLRAPDELAYSYAFIGRERGTAERLERSFLALADLPAGAVDGPHAPALVSLLYEQHLMLKRFRWRLGLVAAAEADMARSGVHAPHAEPLPLVLDAPGPDR